MNYDLLLKLPVAIAYNISLKIKSFLFNLTHYNANLLPWYIQIIKYQKSLALMFIFLLNFVLN